LIRVPAAVARRGARGPPGQSAALTPGQRRRRRRLVQLARLLGRLIRLIIRHPITAGALALLVFLWLTIGWIGVAALAAWCALVLATWRHFWPGSLARLVTGLARNRWRGWCYRRRWSGVMTIAGLDEWHQGRVFLPALGKVSATRYVDRVPVRLVSGQSPADYAARADNLAHGFGALLCRVQQARPGAVVLEF
jgi:DNA segregation ATPase FtsK/SpoIIIE, S-DNA-T family